MNGKRSFASRRTVLKGLGAGSVVGVTSLAGCSGDGGNGGNGGDGSGGNGGGGTTGGGGESDGQINVAATLPESGRLSAPGTLIKQGYELGIEHINQNGGIDGQEINLITRDDQSDPRQVREQLQQITSNNDVQMAWGSFADILVPGGASFAEQQGIPFLGVTFAYMGAHQENDYDWVSVPFPKTRDQTRALSNLLNTIPESERPSRVGLWELNTAWGTEIADAMEAQLTEEGYEIAYRGQYSMETSDFSSLIGESESNDVQVLFSNPTPGAGITAMQQMAEMQFAPEFVQFIRATDVPDWWNALETTGEYVTSSPGWVPGMTGNGNEQFVQGYRDMYDVPSDAYPQAITGAAYNLTQVAAQALADADTSSRESIRDTLRSKTFETVIGSFSFDDVGMPAEGELDAGIGQWWEGMQHLVYPDDDGEAAIDLQYPLQPWSER